MEDREQTSFAQNLNRIRDLNDRLRVSGEGGRIVMTSSIAYVPLDVRTSAMRAIRKFADFSDDNDPWGEHDFGQVTVEDQEFFWKIDYYDVNIEWGSPDPADESVTCRVLTLMLAVDL
jgi:hypothetical protein